MSQKPFCRRRIAIFTLVSALLILTLAACSFGGATAGDPLPSDGEVQPADDSPTSADPLPGDGEVQPADDSPTSADPLPNDGETDAVGEAELTALVLGPEMAMRNDNSFTFDDPTQLSTEELYLLFLLRTDYEVLETCWDESAETFSFSDEFIREQLSRYLKDFRFDITAHQKYDSKADAIVTPLASGFGGDRYTDMTDLTWSGSVATFRLAFYDTNEMTGDPYQIKEYALEFYDGGFYYLYARKIASGQLPEAADLA